MSLYTIITEGQDDVALLRAILGAPEDTLNLSLVAAGGWSGADSLSRSFLVDNDTNVALIVDANSTDPNQVEDRRRFLNESQREVARHKDWRVFVIAPEIEALLFTDRSVVESLVKGPISETDMIRAEYKPKVILQRLLGRRPLIQAYTLLPDLDLSRIREAAPIPELTAFLQGKGSKTVSRKRTASSASSR